jgi:non-homologous end joining protein Ku
MKGGGPAYALVREVWLKTGKVGIVKVAMRRRQHLAALKSSAARIEGNETRNQLRR